MKLSTTSHAQINSSIERFEKELDQYKKVSLMIDLFEVIIKTHTAAIVGMYLHIGKLSSFVKAFLAEGLINTPLGNWQMMSRIIMNELSAKSVLTKAEYKEIEKQVSEKNAAILNKYYQYQDGKYILQKDKLSGFKKEENELYDIFKKLNFKYSEDLPFDNFYSYFFKYDENIDKKKVVNFRNKYAHGATPDNNICTADIEENLETLEEMLKVPFLRNTCIVSFTSEKEMVLDKIEGDNLNIIPADRIEKIKAKNFIFKERPYLLTSDNSLIDLYPIMSTEKSGDKGTSIMFLNKINKLSNGRGEVTYLHYSTGNHIKKASIYNDFVSRIDIPKWKENISDEFKLWSRELTGNYIGRSQEIIDIKNYISSKNSGFFFWFGVPGIGKSALLARTYAELSSGSAENLYLIAYYIKANTNSKKIDNFLDYLHKELDKINSSSLIPRGSETEEKSENLILKLRFFSENLHSKKLVIFIDGLDEGADADILKYIPAEVFKNIIIVLTSRKIAEVEKFYLKLPAAYKTKQELTGLKLEDIRAILYEVINKYEVDNHHIEAIKDKSQGNPLYIKLLCMELEEGRLNLRDINALPSKLEDFYKGIMEHFYEKKIDKIIPALYVVATAVDYLSQQHLKYILNVDDNTAKDIIDALSEILIEQPQKRRYYQLFHESFREYLISISDSNTAEGHHNLIKFCRQWKNSSIYGKELRKYMFQYYSTHLYKLNMKKELYELLEDSDYWREQLNVTGEYRDVYRLYYDAAILSSRYKDEEMMIAAAVKTSGFNEVILEDDNNFIKFYSTDLELYAEKEIKRISHLKGTEQIIQYFKIMYYIILKDNEADCIKRGLLNDIISEFDKEVLRDMKRCNLASTLSLRLLVETTAAIMKLQGYAEPILDRMEITSKLDDYDKEYLAEVFVEPNDMFYEEIASRLTKTLVAKELLAENIVLSYVSRKRISDALSFINSLNDICIKDLCCKELLTMAYRNGDIWYVKDINEIIGLMQQPNIRTQAIEEVTVIAFEKGYYCSKMLFEKIRNVSNRNKASLRISKVLFDKGDYRAAREYIENAFNSIDVMQNFKNKIYLLIGFAEEFIRQGRLDNAEKVIAAASAINYEINSTDEDKFSPGIYSKIYSVYMLLDKKDKAEEILEFLYEKMKDAEENFKDKLLGAAIFCLLEDKDFDTAISKCEEFESDLARGNTLKAIGDNLCMINRTKEAIVLFYKINSRRTAKYLSYSIMKSLVEDNKIEDAIRFIKTVHGTNVFQMKNLLNLLYKKGLAEQYLYKIFNTAPLPGKVLYKDKKQEAYYEIALQLIEAKKYDRARECILLLQDKRMIREASCKLENRNTDTDRYKQRTEQWINELFEYIRSFEQLEAFRNFVSIRGIGQFQGENRDLDEDEIARLYSNLQKYYSNNYLKFTMDYAEFIDSCVDQIGIRSKLYSKFIGNLNIFLKDQKEIFIFMLPHILNNHGAIRNLLSKYALYIRFMSDYDSQTINRLIYKINELEDVGFLVINTEQWCYSNLNTWIDKISSTIDRECILMFKGMVDSGILTVEKFESRIAAIVEEYC